MEIPKFKNPFKKGAVVISAPASAPLTTMEEDAQDLEEESEVIEEQTPEEGGSKEETSGEETEDKSEDITAEQILMAHEQRLQKIEYHLRLIN